MYIHVYTVHVRWLLEQTNICVYKCLFVSFSYLLSSKVIWTISHTCTCIYTYRFHILYGKEDIPLTRFQTKCTMCISTCNNISCKTHYFRFFFNVGPLRFLLVASGVETDQLFPTKKSSMKPGCMFVFYK